jgi:putative intracellular protease/amidase
MGLLLFPGYETLDATGPLQMLSYWDFVQVSIVTKHGKGVASKQNLTLQAKFSFKTAPKFDILFVPGGDVLNVINDKATINYIRCVPTCMFLLMSSTSAYEY